jgi:23S rRNA (cytidine1920-2'-O)/16S rRNA (cytidine1409-2'-O)-methyltransferase
VSKPVKADAKMTRPKQRVDQALVDRGVCESREKAQRAILGGKVRINAQRVAKASERVSVSDVLTLDEPERYVSRGGLKLEHALAHFSVDPAGLAALDLGASTGGFTDCLLQHGAKRVFAVDVGQGQLAWKLRQDPRVTVMERQNARALGPTSFPPPFIPFILVVIDCSFISLQKVLPPAIALLAAPGKLIALIKPQFEAGKTEVDKGGGVITDATIHARVIDELREFVSRLGGVTWVGVTESPLLGPAGNKEFLVLLEKHC